MRSREQLHWQSSQQRSHAGTRIKTIFRKVVSHSALTLLSQGRQRLSCSGLASLFDPWHRCLTLASLFDPGIHPACNQLQWPHATGICGMSKWKSGCDPTSSWTALRFPSVVWELGKLTKFTLPAKRSSKRLQRAAERQYAPQAVLPCWPAAICLPAREQEKHCPPMEGGPQLHWWRFLTT